MRKKAAIGIDLHHDNFTACYLFADMTEKHETFFLTPDGITKFIATLVPKDTLAVESVSNTIFSVRRSVPQ